MVIKDGKILENQLRKQCLNMDDLNILLRQKDVFSVKDVEYATFEPTGKLGVMLKKEKQPATKQDQNVLAVKPTYIPTELVVDGHIVERNRNFTKMVKGSIKIVKDKS